MKALLLVFVTSFTYLLLSVNTEPPTSTFHTFSAKLTALSLEWLLGLVLFAIKASNNSSDIPWTTSTITPKPLTLKPKGIRHLLPEESQGNYHL